MDGKTFLIYATEEGGLFKLRYCDEAEYRQILESGQINETDWFEKREPKFVTPIVVALARVEDHFDFIIGGKRETAERVMI